MATLDRAAFRSANGRKTKDIDVPELDGTLRARMMSGTDLFKLTEHAMNYPKDFDGQARLLFEACLVDDDNQPLFDADSVDALMDQESALVLRLSEDLQEFCGLTGANDDAVKNSEKTPA